MKSIHPSLEDLSKTELENISGGSIGGWLKAATIAFGFAAPLPAAIIYGAIEGYQEEASKH
jgi:bacteriocin-like protein